MTNGLRGLLAVASVVSLLAACTPPGAPPPVPAPQTEVLPLPPISPVELVWRPGYWNWDGSGYRWVPGEYMPRTPQTQMWRQGFWRQDPGGWTWVPPGWV